MKVSRKKVKKEVKFRFSFVVLFFAASFLCCFTLYMKENQPESYYKSGGEIIPVAAVGEITSAADRQKTVRYLKSCVFAGGLNARKMAEFGYIPEDNLFYGNDLNAEKISAVVSSGHIKGLYFLPDISSENLFDEETEIYRDIADNVKKNFPDVNIYMVLLPPSADSAETAVSDGINVLLSDFSKENQLYCLDISSALKDKNGTLPFIYSSDDGMEREAYGVITSYILSHTAE